MVIKDGEGERKSLVILVPPDREGKRENTCSSSRFEDCILSLLTSCCTFETQHETGGEEYKQETSRIRNSSPTSSPWIKKESSPGNFYFRIVEYQSFRWEFVLSSERKDLSRPSLLSLQREQRPNCVYSVFTTVQCGPSSFSFHLIRISSARQLFFIS